MAEYEMQELTLPGSGDKKVLYPRMRLYGQFDLKYLSEYIARLSSFSPGEVKGLLEEFTRSVAFLMSGGYAVKVDGLGVFTPSLGLKEGAEREEEGKRRNAASLRVRDVNFRADKDFVRMTDAHCDLERSRRKFLRSSRRHTPARRLELAREYLESHPYLRVGDYCGLTGLLRNAAAAELRRWAATEGSGIAASGSGSHKVYVKA